MTSLYGEGGIVGLLPRLVWSLVAGPDGLPNERRVALLLLDGLGAQLLDLRRHRAPALASAWAAGGGRTLMSCFPSTTVTGLAAFGLGRPPGEHGLVGAMFPQRAPHGGVMTFLPLKGRFLEDASLGTLQLAPGCVSPWSRVGLPCVLVSPAPVSGSPFQRRVFQACEHRGYTRPFELSDAMLDALRDHRLVIGYADWIDRAGHHDGIGGAGMQAALAEADAVFDRLRRRLPHDVALVCCADHGLCEAIRVVGMEDLAALRQAIVLVCGDARCVQFWVRPGWRERVADHLVGLLPEATVWTRREVVELGLYGPRVRTLALRRLGDLVLTFERPGAALPWSPVLRGHRAHHGGLAVEERLVPLITVRRSGRGGTSPAPRAAARSTG